MKYLKINNDNISNRVSLGLAQRFRPTLIQAITEAIEFIKENGLDECVLNYNNFLFLIDKNTNPLKVSKDFENHLKSKICIEN